jgi:peptide deformylase
LGAVAEEAGQVRTEELDPQREALRQAALAQIRQYPDPVLRMRAKEVEEFDDDLRRLAERMQRLMEDANGVGLAANQVGVVRRVLVFHPDPEGEPVAVVNPVITTRGDEAETDDEGCLSMQGIQVPVERATTVTLEGKDPEGNDVSYELSELGARVAQHELDHLDGVLILERTTDEARKAALAELRPRAMLTPG